MLIDICWRSLLNFWLVFVCVNKYWLATTLKPSVMAQFMPPKLLWPARALMEALWGCPVDTLSLVQWGSSLSMVPLHAAWFDWALRSRRPDQSLGLPVSSSHCCILALLFYIWAQLFAEGVNVINIIFGWQMSNQPLLLNYWLLNLV